MMPIEGLVPKSDPMELIKIEKSHQGLLLKQTDFLRLAATGTSDGIVTPLSSASLYVRGVMRRDTSVAS